MKNLHLSKQLVIALIAGVIAVGCLTAYAALAAGGNHKNKHNNKNKPDTKPAAAQIAKPAEKPKYEGRTTLRFQTQLEVAPGQYVPLTAPQTQINYYCTRWDRPLDPKRGSLRVSTGGTTAVAFLYKKAKGSMNCTVQSAVQIIYNGQLYKLIPEQTKLKAKVPVGSTQYFKPTYRKENPPTPAPSPYASPVASPHS